MTTTTEFDELSVQHLDRPGGRIAYRLAGKGPLVVCLPGMGEIAASYRYSVPALARAGFRVAVMDLRGHGESDATFDRYDDEAAGSDALALIDELGGPAILVGNSMGAGASVWAAAQRPDAVSGVALIGPFVRNAPVNPVMGLLFRVLMLRPWARQSWLSYLPSLYPGRRPDDFEAHRAAIRRAMRRPGATAAFARTTRTDHTAAERSLPQVQIPAAVIMGTADPDFRDPVAEAHWIGEQLNATVTLVDGAGHYPQVEQPTIVGDALVAFCRRVATDA
ncbi:alpha/beta hydrolase [Microbacterium sediminicola]|uniref:Alpha/beta hydrolase n=1 Tax=Microbacterium sediminicola TaxID=415210 RepID=A0ABP4U5L4_9MICO